MEAASSQTSENEGLAQTDTEASVADATESGFPDASHRKHPNYKARRVVNWLSRKVPSRKIIDASRKILFALSMVMTFFIGLLGHVENRIEPAKPIYLEFLPPVLHGESKKQTEPDVSGIIDQVTIWLTNLIRGRKLEIAIGVGVVQIVLAVILVLLRKSSASDSRRRESAQSMLDYYFQRLCPDDPEDKRIYRLTLFRCRNFWLLGHWLGICARSCGTHKNWSTILNLDSESEHGCSGAAGQAWWRACHLKQYQTKTLRVTGSTEGDAYAKNSGLTLQEAANISHKSTCFTSTPVVCNGEVWGILVFDTDDVEWSNGKIKQKRAEEIMGDASVVLSGILSR